MNQKKIIALCASAAHYKNVIEIEKQLKKLGFKVKIPKIARKMHRSGNFDVNFYKTWFNNSNDYYKKTKLMTDHFRKIIGSDAVLVTNFEKNGLPGYVGGNVLMEMVIAFHYKKPIFIYNDISEVISFKEEIYGMKPMFIKGDLKKIKIK